MCSRMMATSSTGAGRENITLRSLALSEDLLTESVISVGTSVHFHGYAGDKAHMSGALYLAVVGHATNCANPVAHSPRPSRFVWHHVLPQIAGGQTVASNLVSLCDNCHYSTHALMYEMRLHEGVIKTRRSVKLRELAYAGYQAARTAGTVGKLPDEGGSIE